MPKLHIVRGLPGSGKSTVAKALGIFHVEADMFHMIDGEYQWTGARVKASHRWCAGQVNTAMKADMDVVVSNTFTQLWEFADYLEAAEIEGYDVVVTRCNNDFGNVHNVPQAALNKMKARFEDFDGETIFEVLV